MKRRAVAILVCAALCMMAVGLSSCQVLASSSTYEPTKKDAVISTPDIGEKGVLRVGVNSALAPFSTQVSGKIIGIDVDIAAAISTEMGLDLELVDVGSDPEGAIKAGTVDVVMNMDAMDTSTGAWLSDIYIPTAVVLFAQSAQTSMPAANVATTIEAQSASMSAWEVTNQFTNATVRNASDLKTAFADLAAGSTNYVAADAVIGSYVAHATGSDAAIIGSLQKVSGYCVGVPASNEPLKKAVSAAVSKIISDGVVNVIEKKWLGNTLDLSKVPLSASAQKASEPQPVQLQPAEGEGQQPEEGAEGGEQAEGEGSEG